MDDKNFKPNKWQLEFIKQIVESKSKIILNTGRQVGKITLNQFLSETYPELYRKYLNSKEED